jgi:hypothetical protein
MGNIGAKRKRSTTSQSITEAARSSRLSPLEAILCLLLATVSTGCFPFFRYQSAACKQQGAVLGARLETLEREARVRLSHGTQRDEVVRFFAENGMAVSFFPDRTQGTVHTTGCAPAGCGTDAAVIHLAVAVDETGAVVGEPEIGAMYTNCL